MAVRGCRAGPPVNLTALPSRTRTGPPPMAVLTPHKSGVVSVEIFKTAPRETFGTDDCGLRESTSVFVESAELPDSRTSRTRAAKVRPAHNGSQSPGPSRSRISSRPFFVRVEAPTAEV